LANGLENGLAIVLPLVVGLAVYEGTTQIAHSLLTAGRVTPYRVYTARIAQYFKPSDRVLGSHTWWLGLLGVDYRSFVVPFWLDDPRYSAEPVSFGQALALLHPNVVLLDPTMTAFFANAADPLSPNYRRYLDYQAYLVAHQAQLAGQVQDPTYGTTQVYRLASP
jgi:hypothetical protein